MALVEPPFSGVGVALITCFRDDGSLDEEASAKHAARLVEAGVRAVVVAGSTGEAATLDREERVHLLDAVRDAVGGRGGPPPERRRSPPTPSSTEPMPC